MAVVQVKLPSFPIHLDMFGYLLLAILSDNTLIIINDISLLPETLSSGIPLIFESILDNKNVK